MTLPTLKLDPRTYARGLGCVHCGLCLPVCPTYTENANEADSPRGRIGLMLALSDGRIEPSQTVRDHLDLCLDCRACETACPSGVVYHELIEETRSKLDLHVKHPFVIRVMRVIFFHVFTHSTRLKLALLPARVMQKIGLYALLRRVGVFKLLPPQFAKMEQMLPADGPLWPKALPEHSRAGGFDKMISLLDVRSPASFEKKRTTVAFFAGCVGSVMFEKQNRQAVELIAACGADVVAPRAQVCCGAIHHHNADEHTAADFARKNIDAYCPVGTEPPEFVTTNIAGCGAMLRDYELLLRDDPAYRDRAVDFAKRVRDISEVLVTLGPPPMKNPVPLKATYHDACHLAHAQRVTTQPRQLLAGVPGLTLVALPESDMCCGAAGTYNLTQPEMATALADRKLNNIRSTDCSTCVTGNVGCAMHIQSEADRLGRKLNVVHPVEILHRAVFGDAPDRP